MKRREIASAAFLLLVGLAALLQTRRLPLGTPAHPDAGFFPFCLASALCLVALSLLVRGFRRLDTAKSPLLEPPSELHSTKVLLALGVLFGYTAALEALGFLTTTFLMILFFFRVVECRPWRVAAGASLAISGLAYGLFTWLGVRLPSGAWGL